MVNILSNIGKLEMDLNSNISNDMLSSNESVGNNTEGLFGTVPILVQKPPSNVESSILRIFPNESDREIFNKGIPLIMFCGLGQSGKTSIIQILYRKMSPYETMSLPSTKQGNILEINGDSKLFPSIGLIDLPGSGQTQDTLLNEDILEKVSLIIFVIDSRNNPYNDEILRAKKLFKKALKINKNIYLEIFMHKTDNEAFSIDDSYIEYKRDIHEKISGYIFQYGFDVDIRYHFTSIYNDSIIEAFSKVIQRVSPNTQTLERLLDVLVLSSSLEKALLMDIHSRTFIACDSSLFDPIGFELCADILNVITEITGIYSPNISISKTSKISCSVKLDTGHFLYIKNIDHNILVACVIRNEHIKDSSLIDINIEIFKQEPYDPSCSFCKIYYRRILGLENELQILTNNIYSLFKTAKEEIQRKNKLIEEKDNIINELKLTIHNSNVK
ncbi:hypothetical protein FG386_000159 [Cryptosporidium ryanae]|uniref:uncharacterized protein n=1 Tax=Cryptosporidium ryanae TaxID=515981 RepID=UPI003519E4EF|nr:hypothetical protein FG386_000159 [Cryptosporidium ryanae]